MNTLLLLTLTLLGPTRAPECVVPPVGDWIVAASCDIHGARVVNGNVVVQPGITLTLAPGASLNVPFTTSHLRVRQGARVRIGLGARIF